MSAGNRKYRHFNSTKELPMKTTTSKTRKAVIVVIVLAIVGILIVGCSVRANAEECPPGETCQVMATPTSSHVDYGNPSYEETCVGEREEIRTLQVRDEYHVDTIANLDLMNRELQNELMMTTSNLHTAEWRIKKQAAKIRHLRALLGR